MSKTKPATVAGDRLRSFVERIERMEEERKAIAGDIRDIYSEAKGVGYDVKTLRKVVQLRKMDAADRDEQEQLLDVYWHALTTVDRIEERAAAGETAREISAAEGVSKSTAHRVSQKARGKNESAKTGQGVKPTIISPPEVEHLSLAPSSGGEGCGPGEVESCSDIRARSRVAPPEESPERVSQFSPQPDGCSTEEAEVEDVVPGEDARAVCPPPLPDAECGVSRAGTHSVDTGIPVSVGAVGSPEGDRVARPAITCGVTPEIDLTIPTKLDRHSEARRAGT